MFPIVSTQLEGSTITALVTLGGDYQVMYYLEPIQADGSATSPGPPSVTLMGGQYKLTWSNVPSAVSYRVVLATASESYSASVPFPM